MAEESYSTQRLDHPGIVAGICQQIGLVEQIDTYVGATERKVSVGEAVQAMVLNAVGFVGSALYLTPEFFDNKPVGLLIREGVTPEDLNDDSLGRRLDMFYNADITQVFQGIDVLLIHNPLGIQRQVLNLKPIHLRVLDLLGSVVKKYYILDG